MNFSALDVKKLREQTGAGMMACKEALSQCSGDFDSAVDHLRKKGLAAAQKKQGRIAAEGVVATLLEKDLGVIVEVNCETDFVSKGDDFKDFVHKVASDIINKRPANIEALQADWQEKVNELTLKIGEKIAIRRFETLKAVSALGSYNHGNRIGVLVNIKTQKDSAASETQELLKDLAMHVAATSPQFLASEDIDEAFKKKEAEIYAAQLKEQGKPENMIDKIVEGKLRKMTSEICLLEQKFVKNPDISIKKMLQEFGGDTNVVAFSKVNLGEGIEKKKDNLAEEVAKMAGGKN